MPPDDQIRYLLGHSSSELDEVAKGSDVAVIWIYDSDGANQGFGKKYEK